MLKNLFLMLPITLASGCSSLYIQDAQMKSSGLVGCHPDEIKIEKHDFSGLTWTATCSNKQFFCNDINDTINCKEKAH